MATKEQEIYNKGVLVSTLQSVNGNMESLKSHVMFLFDEVDPNQETTAELNDLLFKIDEVQKSIGVIVSKNSDDDQYISYM